ncbi:multidrug resistance-associated protein 1 [Magallana gigas]|uniref:multidrug resistance-associated protein 1 n=1 Tax=Magallana gigas TaxID=29159 RepID=UPI003341B113
MEIHLLSIHVFKTGNRRYPIHYLLVRAEVDMNELQTMNEVLRNRNLTTTDQHLTSTSCSNYIMPVWVTHAWIWIITPFYMYYMLRQKTKPNRISWNLVTKSLLLFVNVILLIVQLVMKLKLRNSILHEETIEAVLQISTLILVGVFLYLERWKGFVSSGVLFVYWAVSIISTSMSMYNKILHHMYSHEKESFLIFCTVYATHWLQWTISCFAEISTRSTEGEKNPYSTSSFPGRLLFLWVFSLILRGYRKPITKDDTFPLESKDKADHLLLNFQKNWEKSGRNVKEWCMERRKPILESATEIDAGESLVAKEENEDNASDYHGNASHSLLLTLLNMFGWKFLLLHVLTIFNSVCKMASPQLLSLLLGLLSEPAKEKDASCRGYLLAISLFVVSVFEVLTYIHSLTTALKLGVRVRATLMSALYRKVLKVGNISRQKSSVGEILNLMSVDTSTISDSMPLIGMWFESLLEIMFSLYFLYEILGYAVFAGCGLMVLLVPVNAYLSSKSFKVIEDHMKLNDDRIKLLSEVINGIKILKLYAWEMIFKDKIIAKRKTELRKLLNLKILERILETLFHITPFIVIFATFLTYILINDRPLDAKTVFVSLSFFNILKFSIEMVSRSVQENMKFYVAIKRIQKFLNSDDLIECNMKRMDQREIAIRISNGTFAWNWNSSVLERINMEVHEGKLVALVGNVGQGKSSLLSAILGELTKLKGTVNIKGTVAYAPQQAWILNATVEDNILFGMKMDRTRYYTVLETCALLPDLTILPAGDQTEIGEKGVNLSGGQKHRISLARAVYSDADIYLLDDPLSAVDSHVGSHLFNKVIGPTGMLKDKTRVLVTHGIHWLPSVDQIFVLTDGKISENGTYDELLDHAGPFAEFLENVKNQTDDFQNGNLGGLRRPLAYQNESRGLNPRTRSTSSDQFENRTSLNLDTQFKTTEQYSDVPHIDMTKDILIEEEKTEEGKVKWKRVVTYFKAVGLKYCLLLMLLYEASEGLSLMGNIWLSRWTEDPILNAAVNVTQNQRELQQRNVYYLGCYVSFGIGQVFCVVLFGIFCVTRTISASHIIHSNLLHSILRCPISFFDTTPSGRIMNRFSQDLSAVDTKIPFYIEMALYSGTVLLGTLAAITYAAQWFLLVAIPLGLVYFVLMTAYLPTLRQIKRIEAVCRSPIYSYFSETLAGASVIRAFGKENIFMLEIQKRINDFHRVNSTDVAISGWKSILTELLGCVVILSTSLMAVASRDTISAGMAGLSISYSLQVTRVMNWLVYCLTLVETNVVSIERIAEYTDTESEAALINDTHRPPKNWPDEGQIIFSSYSTKHRPNLDTVLKNINVVIEPRSKIGIVGRTGAGKSSLAMALFRLIEPVSGNIEVDGENLTVLGLHDCRSKLTILPQDPVLFSGSLRMNIDPLNQFKDEQIWSAIEHAHLKSFVQSLPSGLEFECGEGGGNISAGQKQLVCLARSLLQKTKILILDEATAAVDLETDDLIQRTIREEFRDCTVLTIAHRINTVLDYDRIIVLDKGCVMEYDTPNHLLKDPNSLFYELARNAGILK